MNSSAGIAWRESRMSSIVIRPVDSVGFARSHKVSRSSAQSRFRATASFG